MFFSGNRSDLSVPRLRPAADSSPARTSPQLNPLRFSASRPLRPPLLFLRRWRASNPLGGQGRAVLLRSLTRNLPVFRTAFAGSGGAALRQIPLQSAPQGSLAASGSCCAPGTIPRSSGRSPSLAAPSQARFFPLRPPYALLTPGNNSRSASLRGNRFPALAPPRRLPLKL